MIFRIRFFVGLFFILSINAAENAADEAAVCDKKSNSSELLFERIYQRRLTPKLKDKIKFFAYQNYGNLITDLQKREVLYNLLDEKFEKAFADGSYVRFLFLKNSEGQIQSIGICDHDNSSPNLFFLPSAQPCLNATYIYEFLKNLFLKQKTISVKLYLPAVCRTSSVTDYLSRLKEIDELSSDSSEDDQPRVAKETVFRIERTQFQQVNVLL